MHRIMSEDSKETMDSQNGQDSSEKSQTNFLSILGLVLNGTTLD